LRVSSVSVNVDLSPAPRLLWRVEARGIRSRDPVFTHGGGNATAASRNDSFVVTSVALTF
jgi:hypothetical protein